MHLPLRIFVAALGAAFVLAAGPLRGAAAVDPAAEANRKLREALRNTMIQLRTVETEKATAQAAQAELEQKNKELEERIKGLEKRAADLSKRAMEEKDVADRAIAGMRSQVANRDAELAQYKDALEKWKAAHKQAADFALAKEVERGRAASQVIVLQRKVEDHERRNAEMYRLGNEILTRYERFGLGTALLSREPFVGATRVKLQNLFQDYADKLADQRIRPEDTRPAPAKRPTPGGAGGAKPAETAQHDGKPQEGRPERRRKS